MTTIQNEWLDNGKLLVIRTDGSETVVPVLSERSRLGGILTIDQIRKLIGADTLDFVAIGKADGTDLVMAVDDLGWECEMIQKGPNHFESRPVRPRKPINQKATELYHAICKPGTTHQIAGDVCICHDGDFA